MFSKEYIYYARFNSEVQRHDRILYLKGKHTKKDFFDWIEKCRKEIEDKVGHPTVVDDMKII